MIELETEQTDLSLTPAPCPDPAIGMYSSALFHDRAHALSVLGLPTVLSLAMWYAIISLI